MVERLQEPRRGATFVDLDGTLLRGNSLKFFMRRLPLMLLKRRAPGASLLAMWWMGWRALRVVGHANMKWHVTRLAVRHFTPDDWDALALGMAARVNATVMQYVESPSRAGCARYIATAAPMEYALPLSRQLGLDGAVATSFADSRKDYEETRGLAKLEAIRQLLEENDYRLESFLTDHFDDIPTARAYPRLTVLVNPDRKMQAIFRNVGVTRYLMGK